MRKIALLAALALLIAGTPTVPVMAANEGVETAGTVHAAESTEAQVQAFVERMYNASLGRSSDSAGLADWTSQLLTHEADGAGIARGFILSDEFKGRNLNNEEYVNALYYAFFNREPDEGGKADWLNRLTSGQSREVVLAGFVNSGEFDNLCESFGIARGILFDNGDAANPSIRLFVERMYTKALNRPGEKAGIDDWTSQIVYGVSTPEQVAKGFFFSKELNEQNLNDDVFVERLYETFMDRKSDQEGKENWMNALANGASKESVLEGFSRSNEFGEILVEFGLAEEAGQEPEQTAIPDITPEPTEAPTIEPTEAPTEEPTEAPTTEPTEAPTEAPTATPAPTPTPTSTPKPAPTWAPGLIRWEDAEIEDYVIPTENSGLGSTLQILTGIEDRDIMLSDLWYYTELDLSYCGLNNLNIVFLADLKNLTALYLYNNYIQDVRCLEALPNLKALNLSHNGVSLYSLEKLTHLEMLSLADNNYPDSRVLGATLQKLPNLTFLELSSSELRDVNGLAGLTNLEILYLTDNDISDLSGLETLTNLTYLNLDYNNNISDISPLANLTNLTELRMQYNEVSDISPLANLTNLTTLVVTGILESDNKIDDISPLANLTNLTYLGVVAHNITDISCLKNMTNLTDLHLQSNNISDISPLAGLTNLEYLNLAANNISDISSLAGLTNLENLDLNNNKISDISSLAGMTNMKFLYLSNNKISDISPLANMKNLTSLYLSKNEITDYSPIKHLEDSGCYITK